MNNSTVNQYFRSILILFLIVFASNSIAQSDNYAMSFPGGSDGNLSNIDITGLGITELPVTIEMWIKPNGDQIQYAGLFYHRNDGNTANAGLYYAAGWEGTNMLRVDFSGTKAVTPAIAPSEWHHVAAVITSTSKTIYVDGQVAAANTTDANTNYDFSVNKLYLGWDRVSVTRTFNGLMDEVRVWNVARTQQEIEDNRYLTLNGDETGLVGYWNFDDQSATATDVTGHGYNGTITGGTYVVNGVVSDVLQTEKVVNKNAKNEVVMQFHVETPYLQNPLTLDSITFSTNGTTLIDDITNVRLYATGTDATFNTLNLVSELGGTPENEEFSMSTDYELIDGINYFWITYDVSADAVNGNNLDIECLNLTISGNEYVPTTTAPDGKLTVNSDLFINYAKLGNDIITTNGYTSERSANFVSFQQNALMTYKGYQYVCYWNKSNHVCLARKKMPKGNWEEIEFTDYATSHAISDNHYNISFGICENDGTIHLSYDHHNDDLNYRVSITDLANKPDEAVWNSSSFGSNRDYLEAGISVTSTLFYGAVTYPRFISKPDGDLLFECRTGISGDGNSHLWEYSADTQTWSYIGEYLHGRSDGMPVGYSNKCGYINGLHYDQNGRLHVSLVWRETPSAPSNHDVYYAYSDDDGRTWYNAAGSQIGVTGSTTMANILNYNSFGFKVVTIGENRGLINQESQAVDSKGGIHILQSYMLDSEPSSTDWMGSRAKAWTRHIYQDESGTWQNDLIAPVVVDRSEIAVDEADNLYVVIPGYKVYYATAANKWKTWTELDISEYGTTTAEPIVDREALLNESVLSFAFAHKDMNGKLIVPYYLIDKSKSGTGNGLNVSMFDDTQFSTLLSQSLDSVNLTSESIVTPLSGDSLSIRLSGQIETMYAEVYTYYLTTSADVKIWINDILKNETSGITSETEVSGTLDLQPSHKYYLKVEGKYKVSNLALKLDWSSDRQERSIVPKTALYGQINDIPDAIFDVQTDKGRLNVSCYPNPSNNEFNINVNGRFNYSVYDLNGSLILNGKAVNYCVFGNQLGKGVYFLQIESNNLVKIIKVIKY